MEEFKKNGLSFVEKAADKDDEYFNVAKELIENLFFDMTKLCTKYCNDTFCDLPYTYRERMLDSVLLPTLSKLCNSMVMVEVPASRHCSNRRFNVEESSGRIDYWCIYKNYSFVIELKHSYDCFTTNKTRQRTIVDRWIKMNEQLDSVKEELKDYQESTKGIVRLGLHFITSYSDKNPCKELMVDFKNSIPDTFERLPKDLSKRFSSLCPDIIMCWKIPENIVFEYDQTFPGLWAITKIYPPIRHKGMIK